MPDPTSTPTISVQLYSVYEEWSKDQDTTLARLATIGYTTVEAFDFVQRPDEVAAALTRHGLRAGTGHALFLSDSNEQLTVLPLEQTLESAAKLGVEYVIDPFVHPDRWRTREEIQRTADRMNRAAEAAQRYGMGVAYHNHGHELAIRVEDRPALELFAELVDPAVGFEVDLYWAAAGGVDPVELVSTLGDRVVAVHVKDGAAGADPLALVVPDGQTAAGRGDVPLTAALEAVTALKYAIVEFDRYPDIFEGVESSYAFLSERGLR